MKILLSISIFLTFFGTIPELSKVREEYIKVGGNKEVALKLHESLSEVTKKDNKVLVAYKGAILAIVAKYTKDKNVRKEYFKEGAGLIEYAVASQPNNIEIRVVRLSIQENSPKFLKYQKNILEDKQFILENYKNLDSKEIQNFVKSYVMQSEAFNISEKGLF